MKKFLFAALAACVSSLAFSATSPKAVYDKVYRTLTFYYDELDHSGPTKSVYSIDDKGTRSWDGAAGAQGATNIIFHSSFYQFKPTTMKYWFKAFNALLAIECLENLDSSQVTDMEQLFRQVTSLKTLDIRHLDTSNVSNMTRMFADSTVLTTIYVDDLFATNKAATATRLFENSKNVKGGNGTAWSSSHANVDYAHVDVAGAPGYFTHKSRVQAPTIDSVSVVSISQTDATLRIDGSELARGAVEIKLLDGETEVASATINDFEEKSFTGLSPNTTYSVHVTATSTHGTATDDSFSFATLDTPADHWVYANGTITWGDWSFAAAATSTKTPTQLQVKTVSTWPIATAPLDFSLPVRDESGTEYTIVTLNPGFSNTSSYKKGGNQPQCLRVGELSLPPNVVTISYGAFGGCVNASGRIKFPSTLTSIVQGAFCDCYNLEIDGDFPAGVTTITQYTYRNTRIDGDLDLSAITTVGAGSFQGTSVGHVIFGPSLTSIGGGSGVGAFSGCENLTNVTFDAAATYDMNTADSFYGCIGLEEIDFKGIRTFLPASSDKPSHSHISGCTKLKRIIFGSKLDTISTNSIANASALEEVVFNGPPPSNIQLPLFCNYAKTQKITTLVKASQAAVKNSEGVCWNDYAAGGAVLKSGSTWAEEYAESGIDLTMRPLLLKPEPGLIMILR